MLSIFTAYMIKSLRLLLLSTLCLILLMPSVSAQSDTPPDGINLEAFRTWLKQNWYDAFENISTSTSSGYTGARLEMYNIIDPIGDSLYCFYSAYSIYRPASGFGSPGDISPMDCEHIVPQSVFNSAGPMKNDIHHLAPTYSSWNSTRGSLPFGDSDDLSTDRWMRYDDQINCSGAPSCIPDSDIIDQFSELLINQSWEPRESVKGNVARSVFYFYTMYPNYDIEAMADISELYQWHLLDPVDTEESDRNDDTEAYQGNRNPYIDHPEWVYTAWIDSLPTSVFEYPEAAVSLYPNPSSSQVFIQSDSYPLSYSLIDINGLSLSSGKLYDRRQPISIRKMSAGLFYLKIQTSTGYAVKSFFKN